MDYKTAQKEFLAYVGEHIFYTAFDWDTFLEANETDEDFQEIMKTLDGDEENFTFAITAKLGEETETLSQH